MAIKIEERMKAYKKGVAMRKAKLNQVGKFPTCVGHFPECVGYTEDMKEEDRIECRCCPYRK